MPHYLLHKYLRSVATASPVLPPTRSHLNHAAANCNCAPQMAPIEPPNPELAQGETKGKGKATAPGKQDKKGKGTCAKKCCGRNPRNPFPQNFSILRNILEYGRWEATLMIDKILREHRPATNRRLRYPAKRSQWKIQVGPFTIKRNYSGHQECSICKLHFATWGALKRHSQVHLNKAIKCRACRRLFNVWDELRAHELTHFVYRCGWCLKGFLVKSSFQAHLRQHTGERPYGCASCHKRYTNLPGLYYHLKKFPEHTALPYRKADMDSEGDGTPPPSTSSSISSASPPPRGVEPAKVYTQL